MPTTTVSTRGQMVIPAVIRAQMGIKAGDKMSVSVSHDGHVMEVKREETLHEMGLRLSRYVKPGTEPLLDVHGFYDQRSPRL